MRSIVTVALGLMVVLCTAADTPDDDFGGVWTPQFGPTSLSEREILILERLSPSEYLFVWYRVFQSEITSTGTLSYDARLDGFLGRDAEGNEIVLYPGNTIEFSKTVGIGYLVADDEISMYPLREVYLARLAPNK